MQRNVKLATQLTGPSPKALVSDPVLPAWSCSRANMFYLRFVRFTTTFVDVNVSFQGRAEHSAKVGFSTISRGILMTPDFYRRVIILQYPSSIGHGAMESLVLLF
jgi:hypothetical protein